MGLVYLGNKKYDSQLQYGQSRYGDYGVMYAWCKFHEDCENGAELYAEMIPLKDEDETIAELEKEIAKQAEEKGIDLNKYIPIFD